MSPEEKKRIQEEFTNWLNTEDNSEPRTENAIADFFLAILDTQLEKQSFEIEKSLLKGFDKLETNDPDTSVKNWINYKFIRNNIRDIIRSFNQ